MARILSLIIVSLAVGIFFLQNSQSYDDKTTHPALTDEIVDFYNGSQPVIPLTSEQKELIVQGAIDEDLPPRWINHFYDPTNGEGWKAEDLGRVSTITLRFFSRLLFNSNTEIVSSKQWARDEALQLRYSNYGGNNTWDNALRQYAKGNKKEAYYILGHILHLLEDVTVPDHTRNDTHAHEVSSVSQDGGSPYEDYGKNFNRQNLTTAQDLLKAGKRPVLLSSIEDYFDGLAKYSNGYFFSEDTINKKYSHPKILREDQNYGYGRDNIGSEFVLVEIKLITKDNFDTEKVYTLKNKYVLSSYFSRLTQEAVINGAGVVKLFHDEAEKITAGKIQLSVEPQVSWWQAEMRSPLYGVLTAYDDVKYAANQAYTVSRETASAVYSTAIVVKDGAKQAVAATGSFFSKVFSVPLSFLSASVGSIPSAQPVAQQPVSQMPTPITSSQDVNIAVPKITANTTPPPAPQITTGVVSPASLPLFAPDPNLRIPDVDRPDDTEKSEESSLTPNLWKSDFGNGADQTITTITTVATTTIASASYQGGGWSSGVSVNDALISPAYKYLETRLISDNVASSTVTSTAPIADDSIATSTDDVATSTPDTVSDIATSTEDAIDTATSTEDVIDTATSTPDMVTDIATSTDSVATSTESVATSTDPVIVAEPEIIYSDPVVINEIAWMGTQAQANDEWIELYNKTNNDIDLTNWTLESPDGSPKIEFNEQYKNKVKADKDKTPIIKAKAYFLLERTNDDATTEEADWIFTGALDNADYSKTDEERSKNEGIILKENGVIIDKVSIWYAGDKDKKTSMERISPNRAGDDIDNWKDNDEITTNGSVLGTPKKKNSSVKIMDGIYGRNVEFLEYPDIVYLIKNFQLESGFTLTVNAGAIVKFNVITAGDSAADIMDIYGALIVKGSADKKIYFTSGRDDSIGGDTNGDGDATLPNGGDWDGIHIKNSAQARLERAEIKYADRALDIDSADVRISDSSVLFSKSEAIYSRNGSLTVLDDVFEGSDNEYAEYAIYTSDAGMLTLKNNVFKNNEKPLYIDYKTNLINSGNIADENDYAGIFLYAENSDYKYDFNKTLYKDIPYIFVKNLTIEKDVELIIEPGVVVKLGKSLQYNSSIDVYGKLTAKGSPDNKIIFTSLNDDSVGGKIFKGGYHYVGADNWGGFSFNPGSQDSSVENLILRKADGGMYFDGVNMSLANVEILDGKNNGIVGYGSILNFKDSRFADIKGDGFVIYDGSVASISSSVMENIDGDVVVIFKDSDLILKNSSIKNIGGDGGSAVVVFGNSIIDIADSVLSGGENNGIVLFDGVRANISSSTLENFQKSAVFIADNVSANIKNSIVRNNDYGINVAGDSSVSISSSAIYDNIRFGILNDPAKNTVSAQNNWWGDGSGPYNVDLNKNGIGNEVSGGVDFAQWVEVEVED